jgi:hypothetical protein
VPVEGPDVIPSPVDPDYECIRVDGRARPPGAGAEPDRPEEGAAPAALCPDGYVPRRKRRNYTLEGKEVRTGEPPLHNPEPRPE